MINMMDDNEPEFTDKSNTEQPPKKQSEKHARFSVANVINPSSKGNAAETIRFSNEKQDDEVRLIGFFKYYIIPLLFAVEKRNDFKWCCLFILYYSRQQQHLLA